MRRRDFITFVGGAVATSPFAASAQQSAVPVIGYLHVGNETSNRRIVDAFRQGLADAGYVEGRNIAIEFRWANLQLDRLPELAAELVRLRVAAIVASGGIAAALAAKAATSTIPIVMFSGADPVHHKLVQSLNRPGGNVTGVTLIAGELSGKRLELLREIVPNAKTVGYMAGDPGYDEASLIVAATSQKFGQELIRFNINSPPAIDVAFGTMARRQVDALLIGAFPAAEYFRAKIVTLAALYKIPAIYPTFASVFDGGLMSYSIARGGMHQIATQYLAPILKGAKPADLPVQQPTKFELVINLKAAKELGLKVPRTLLSRADEVIE
jgi:putative ABC transport system substrate-binding protein